MNVPGRSRAGASGPCSGADLCFGVVSLRGPRPRPQYAIHTTRRQSFHLARGSRASSLFAAASPTNASATGSHFNFRPSR